MTLRSSTPEVRNPILALPGLSAVLALPAEVRGPLSTLLMELSADANERAEKSWSKKKGPMAAYWKAASVYAKHVARAVRP